MTSHRRALLGACVVAGLTVTAGAGGIRDLADAWLVPPSVLAQAWEPGAGAPARWRVEVATGRLHGLAELPQSGIAVSRRQATWSWHAGWERLGGTLLEEDAVRLAVMLGRGEALGVEAGWDRLRTEGGATMRQPALAVRVGGDLVAGLHGEIWLHLRRAPAWFGATGLRRWARVTWSDAGWAAAAVLDRAGDGRPEVQVEAILAVAPGAALGLRLAPATGCLGLCTAWRRGALVLRTAHLVHPELGTTHRVALAVEVGR